MATTKGAKEETCGNCGRSPDEGETFNRCSRCKVVPYCGRACQVHHWKNGHKQTCGAASEREEEDETAKKQNKTKAVGAADELAKTKDRPKPSSSSSEAAADRKPKSPRKVTRVDAKGAPLSFGKHDNCAICLDTMRNPIRLPSCGHWYCKECVEGLRQAASAQDVCPVCREPLPPGPEKLFDEAVTKYLRIQRQVERLGGCVENERAERERAEGRLVDRAP